MYTKNLLNKLIGELSLDMDDSIEMMRENMKAIIEVLDYLIKENLEDSLDTLEFVFKEEYDEFYGNDTNHDIIGDLTEVYVIRRLKEEN